MKRKEEWLYVKDLETLVADLETALAQLTQDGFRDQATLDLASIFNGGNDDKNHDPPSSNGRGMRGWR